MNKKYITKRSFNKLNYLANKIHSESELFFNDDEIYKFLKGQYLDRKQVIERLDILDNSNIVTPNSLLYDRKGFLGYTMTYYKDYIELSNINLKKLSFNERKNLCLKLCDTINYMSEKNFAYPDINEENILIKDDNIKIIDIDSGIFKDIDKEKYDFSLRFSNYLLSNICLSILYSKNYYDFTRFDYVSTIPKELSDFYDFIVNRNGAFISTMEFIDKIDENTINKSKKLLKRSI